MLPLDCEGTARTFQNNTAEEPSTYPRLRYAGEAVSERNIGISVRPFIQRGSVAGSLLEGEWIGVWPVGGEAIWLWHKRSTSQQDAGQKEEKGRRLAQIVFIYIPHKRSV